MSVINRDEYKPLYMQIADYLMDQILKGEWPVGSLVPSEDRLVSQFNVSRNTVRMALARLERNGYIHRIRGRGTFVSSSKLNQLLNRLRSFHEDVEGLGMTPCHQILQVTVKQANPELAAKLEIREKAPVICLHRLLLANQLPYILSKTYITKAILDTRGITLTTDTLGGGSLYEFFDKHGIHLWEATEKIRAEKATREYRQQLGISEGAPVLVSERISKDVNGVVIEFTISIGHPERHEFTAKLYRIPT